MTDLVGGCLCGEVRYSTAAEPVFTAICHCKNCQKQAGTAFSVVMAFPTGSLSIDGSLKAYQDKGDSGQPVHRNFCPQCGSPITSVVSAMPNLVFLKAGTLDDTAQLKPTMEIYCSSAQPWVAANGETQKFAKGPG